MPRMPQPLLVRHGQASFGSDHYDQLGPLGERQCHRLGTWLAQRGRRFAAVYTGTLQRQRQSLAALADGLGLPLDSTELPGLDEYDSHAVLATVQTAPLPRPDTPEAYRQHFRLLRQGLTAWMEGRTRPAGMPGYAEFAAGVRDALARAQHCHGDVLIVSSGGPIACAVVQVLGAPATTGIDLNMRIRNSALTEFDLSPKRLALQTFNTLPHLDDPALADWVTYT